LRFGSHSQTGQNKQEAGRSHGIRLTIVKVRNLTR
jgi:hypothetical protein